MNPAPPQTAEPYRTAGNPARWDDDTLLLVSKANRTTHLTSLADECLPHRIQHDERSSASLVTVAENHSHGTALGIRNPAPLSSLSKWVKTETDLKRTPDRRVSFIRFPGETPGYAFEPKDRYLKTRRAI